MEQNLHLGRIHGIEIGANWSLLLIAGLITASLAIDILPAAAPHQPTAAYWLTGAVTATLFFASLVAHEVSHALVAGRHGVEVKQITLWLFGGVAKLETDTTDPAAELRIGGIGPIVSITLGASTLALASLTSLASGPTLAVAALTWIGGMNILLGAFNLLPAFPLDGGRVLRALLWRRSGDHVQATERAGRVGAAFGYLLAGFGFVLLLSGLLFNGLWFLFLGWFLLHAAQAEVAATVQHDLLAGVRVEQVMTPDPVVAPAGVTVAALINDYVLRFRHSAYPIVTPSGDVVGLVTLDRVRHVPPNERATVLIGQVALRLEQIPIANPRDEVSSLLPALAGPQAGRALVLDHKRLVGIVSLSDVARALDARSLTSANHVAERPDPALVP